MLVVSSINIFQCLSHSMTCILVASNSSLTSSLSTRPNEMSSRSSEVIEALRETLTAFWSRQRTKHFLVLSLVFTLLVPYALPACYLSLLQRLLSLSALVYLAWSVAVFAQLLLPQKAIESQGKAVLITGCDTGFGHRLAHRLASAPHRFHVFAGCLSAQSDGAQALRAKYSEDQLTVVQLDVTKDDSVGQARTSVEDKLKQLKKRRLLTHEALWAVVNNAGIMQLLEIEFGDMRPYQAQLEVNTLGTVRTTKAFLPLLRASSTRSQQRGQAVGRVVNVASLAGRFTFPGFVAYCMSKGAVIGFSDGLRREAAKWGVEVVCIEPHLYK